MLTNRPVSQKAAPLESILHGTGLIHSTSNYPVGVRNPLELLRLRNEIRKWKPEVLVYLAAPRGERVVRRDLWFFRACGIRQVVGAPLGDDLAEHKRVDQELWEPEAVRLSRCLAELGDAEPKKPESWDLLLSEEELAQADSLLDGLPSQHALIAISVGAKAETKDWGDENWRQIVFEIQRCYGNLGLVLIGSADERQRSQRLAQSWAGPVLNLCGCTNPRESAAVLSKVVAFIGHDSGPMHLAAAVGTPCVAIFSARNKPGVWFPFGRNHQVIYHRTECFDCRLEICLLHQKKCILSISTQEVMTACHEILASSGNSQQRRSLPTNSDFGAS